jgi:hypothetical protein
MTTTTDNQEVAQRHHTAGKMSPRTAAWGLARRERKSVMARRPAQELKSSPRKPLGVTQLSSR